MRSCKDEHHLKGEMPSRAARARAGSAGDSLSIPRGGLLPRNEFHRFRNITNHSEQRVSSPLDIQSFPLRQAAQNGDSVLPGVAGAACDELYLRKTYSKALP